MQRLEAFIASFHSRNDFSFFCGWGAQSFLSLRLGADGVVPSTGNLVPQRYKILYEAVENKDYALAGRMQQETDEVAALYQSNRTLGQSLAALKVMMEVQGFCKHYMAPPLTELPTQESEALANRWQNVYKKEK
jgi:4-hydroxy-tetrahydrodipicolinate synthase